MHKVEMTEETASRVCDFIGSLGFGDESDAASELVGAVCTNGKKEGLGDYLFQYRHPGSYTFQTSPDHEHTKVGFTNRDPQTRIDEWRRSESGFKDLIWDPSRQWSTAVSDERGAEYFRDEGIHKELRKRGYHQFTPQELAETGEAGTTREAFDGLISNDEMTDIIEDMKRRARENPSACGFPLYSPVRNRKATDLERLREPRESGTGLVSYTLRPPQNRVLTNARIAIQKGRKKLLLAAAPRFGKTLTAMKLAKQENARFVIVACAMSNAKIEWAETVLMNKDFLEYEFLESDDLKRDKNILDKIFESGRRAVVFVTLADIQGTDVKAHHEQLGKHDLDCLFIDETHQGARGASYSAKLGDGYDDTVVNPDDMQRAVAELELNPKLRVDISGTPYDILASGEYALDDIICSVRYEDMLREQEKWFKEHPGEPEADNPYFGLPQILKMAFTLSTKDSELLRSMRNAGIEGSLLEVFATNDDGKLRHRELAKKFLSIFFGFSSDTGFMSLLADPAVVASKVGEHIVFALDRKAACDEVSKIIAELLSENGKEGEYEIIPICSAKDKEPGASEVRARISAAAKNNKKTISLTVNRMLTATSVPEWSLMLYAKKGSSAQAYVQAMLRLGTAWVVNYEDGQGNKDKRCEKEQSLFIDLDPVRMLAIQAQSAHLAARDKRRGGDTSAFETTMREDLDAMPALLVDNAAGRCHKVEFEDAMTVAAAHLAGGESEVEAVVKGIGIDEGLREDAEIMSQLASSYRGSSAAAKEFVDSFREEEEPDDIDGLEEAAEASQGDGEPSDDDGKPGAGAGDGDDGADGDADADDTPELDEKTYRDMVRDFYLNLMTLAFCSDERLSSLDEFIAHYSKDAYREDLASFNISLSALNAFAAAISPCIMEDFDFAISKVSAVRHNKKMTPEQKSETVFGKIASFSTNEVPTPKDVVLEMFGAIGDEELDELIGNGERVLEIGSQRCEFTEYVIRHMREEGYGNDAIGEAVAVIPSSAAAGVLVRTLMEMYGVPTDNVATFSMMDLYDKIVEEKRDYTKIARILCQAGKTFSEIRLGDEVGDDAEMVKFGSVVGNPPYQLSQKGTSDKAIYPDFMDLSYEVSDLAVLITPARFLFRVGKTPKKWNEKMLSDPHLRVCLYEPVSGNIFAGTDVKGGIAVTKRDRTLDNPGGIQVFVRFKELASIASKVNKQPHDGFVSDIVFAPESYKFTKLLHQEHPEIKGVLSRGHDYDITSNIFDKLGEVVFFSQEPQDDKAYIQIYGRKNNKRIYMWIDRRYIAAHDNLDKYKVMVPKSNGSGAIGEVLSTPLIGQPLIGQPLIGHTQSFISLGQFETAIEANACLKYIKTKFARALLGILKVTQDNKKNVWSQVPLQDFTSNSDIDWSKSIAEIDQQLYKKYGLDDDEIKFIEEHVTPME